VSTEVWIDVVVLIPLVLASAFFSGSESAFFSLGPYRVRRIKTHAEKSFAAAQKLLAHPPRLIATILTGNELVNTSIGVVGSSLVYTVFHDRVAPQWLPVLAVLFILPFVLILGEVVPKSLGVRDPERYVRMNAVPLSWFSAAIAPVRDFLTWLSDRAMRWVNPSSHGGEAVEEDVFRSIVDVGLQEGVLGAQEQKLIHNVFQLDDVRVRQLMTPASKVSSLREDMTVRQALDRIAEEQYSRYPVLSRDGRSVVGVLYSKDLLSEEVPDEGAPLSAHTRPPLVVAPDSNGLELFARFRSRQTHFGVLLEDPGARYIGVVTLEDVLEEIFGEIRDERDLEEGPSKP
jgi:putative hemolysin